MITIGGEEVGETEVRWIALLLTQTWYPTDYWLLTISPKNYYVIPIAIGIEKFEEPISIIAAFQLCQQGFSLLTQSIFLCLIFYLPGEKEV